MPRRSHSLIEYPREFVESIPYVRDTSVDKDRMVNQNKYAPCAPRKQWEHEK